MSNLPNLLDIYDNDAEWLAHDAFVNDERERLARIAEEDARRRALGAEYAAQTFATFDMRGQPKLKDALRTCRQFCINVKDGQFAVLVLLGDNGTGKTHLLRAITNELGGIYTDEMRLVDEYQKSRAFDADEDEEHMLHRIMSYKMRCIDEVGRSDRVALSRELLFRIVDNCVNMRKPLAIATNLQNDAFIEHIGSAVRSRLNGCAVSVNTFGVADYRLEHRSV